MRSGASPDNSISRLKPTGTWARRWASSISSAGSRYPAPASMCSRGWGPACRGRSSPFCSTCTQRSTATRNLSAVHGQAGVHGGLRQPAQIRRQPLPRRRGRFLVRAHRRGAADQPAPRRNPGAGRFCRSTTWPTPPASAARRCRRARTPGASSGAISSTRWRCTSSSRPEKSDEELEKMVRDAEEVCEKLGLTYRMLQLCTGDLGFAATKSYDIEMWAPGCEEWLEVAPAATAAISRRRRANIRYRPQPGAKPRVRAHPERLRAGPAPRSSSPSWRTTSRPTAA